MAVHNARGPRRLAWLCGLGLLVTAAVAGCASPGKGSATPPDTAVPAPTAHPATPAAIASPTLVASPSPSPVPASAAPAPTATPTPVVYPTAPGPIFGVQTWSVTRALRLPLLLETRSNWVRSAGVHWATVETTEGARNWAALARNEAQFIKAAENGLTLIVIVNDTPWWARKVAGSSCGPVRADKLEAFGDFMHDLVARYSAPPYGVKYWEIWNEPDVDPKLVAGDSPFGCWGDAADDYYGGGYYAEMLKVVYPRIKAADPEAQVWVGGLLLDCHPGNPPPGKDCKPARFLEGILRAGGADYFDGVSYHAYDYYVGVKGKYINQGWSETWEVPEPAMIGKSKFLKEVLAAHGVTGKYLVNTEVALLCPSRAPQIKCDAVHDLTQAYYVPQVYAAALAEGVWANIWYSWDDDSSRQALISRTGQPKPAYYAYQFAAQIIGEARFVRDIADYDGVRIYELDRGDRRLWILWTRDGEERRISLPGVPAAAYDVDGTPLTVARQLTVAAEPLYLEWEP